MKGRREGGREKCEERVKEHMTRQLLPGSRVSKM